LRLETSEKIYRRDAENAEKIRRKRKKEEIYRRDAENAEKNRRREVSTSLIAADPLVMTVWTWRYTTTDSWYSPKARRRASEISPTVA
jgi:hypothetical protein